MQQKLFIGPKIRRLREERGWKLEPCAQLLGLSTSYLSQIEANQRPVTARVLIAMMKVFDVDAASLDADDEQRLMADLRERRAARRWRLVKSLIWMLLFGALIWLLFSDALPTDRKSVV